MTRQNFYRAELIERVDFSKELALFRFRPDGEFTFRSGQYATIGIENGDKIIQRPYSIVSSPYEPFLEFYIELVPNGSLTPRLWDLKVGDSVWTRNRIVGHFTLDEKSGMKNHLMLATVTGAAPFISMVRTHKIDLEQGKGKQYKFLIIQGASHSMDFGVYRKELAEATSDGWLTYIPTVSRPWLDSDWKGETGRVEDIVRKYADLHGFNCTNSVAYSCGHPQMIQTVKSILDRAGYPKEHVKEEKYF